MNISPKFFRDPLSDAAGGASAFSPVGAVASGLQVITGLAQVIGGNKQMKMAKAKRKAYEIPDEIYKILNASMNRMGGDAETLNYETNKITQAGATSLGLAARLGADPNMLSALLDQQTDALEGAAQRNHASVTENFGRLLQGYSLLADNKAAKWKSEQDIVKDDMQAADEKMKAGMGNIAGGVNTAISVDSATRAGNLYKDRTNALSVMGGTEALGKRITDTGIGVSNTPPPQVINTLMETSGGSGNGVMDYLKSLKIDWSKFNWKKT